MGKLIPLLLALIGLSGGVGAGLALKPAAEAADPDNHVVEPTAEGEHAASVAKGQPETTEDGVPTHDYVKLNNQFVIPVIEDGKVSAMVIMALSLEVALGDTELVYAREPKLRDALLQVMFDHANSGGFRGTFTESSNMVVLRDALREVAIKTVGPSVTDVLIIDMARQDL